MVEASQEVCAALGGDGDGEAAYPWMIVSVAESRFGTLVDGAGYDGYFLRSGSPLLSSGIRGDFLRDGHEIIGPPESEDIGVIVLLSEAEETERLTWPFCFGSAFR